VAIGVAIALIALLLVCGGVGIAGYLIYASAEEEKPSTRDALSDVVDYRKAAPAVLTRHHQIGRVAYTISPPVGGDHNAAWQNCEGDVYSAEIPKEHAVHSLEHGAVWVTYRSGLSQDQVDKLAGKVRGKEYTLMSPYPGLDRPISLQAWGYQLKLDDADDAAVDAFISKYARTATMEPGAPCGSGETTTGSAPRGS